MLWTSNFMVSWKFFPLFLIFFRRLLPQNFYPQRCSGTYSDNNWLLSFSLPCCFLIHRDRLDIYSKAPPTIKFLCLSQQSNECNFHSSCLLCSLWPGDMKMRSAVGAETTFDEFFGRFSSSPSSALLLNQKHISSNFFLFFIRVFERIKFIITFFSLAQRDDYHLPPLVNLSGTTLPVPFRSTRHCQIEFHFWLFPSSFYCSINETTNNYIIGLGESHKKLSVKISEVSNAMNKITVKLCTPTVCWKWPDLYWKRHNPIAGDWDCGCGL